MHYAVPAVPMNISALVENVVQLSRYPPYHYSAVATQPGV